jgi:serine/threonine protein kinase
MKNELPSDLATESNGNPSGLAPGAILQDRYRIVSRLGSGGMGAVYEAVDQRLDTTVALKETFSVDKLLRRQFEQEARLLAQLHHPALPRVSDYFTEGERAFLVMQFISGADLAQIIATQPGPFPRKQVIAWADQLLDALVYLHTRDRQIIHRDIKPHNLKLTASGQIALLDFGLAKAEAADISNASSSASIFGYTRRYSPLEQIQDQGTSPQSDIYALGATLYHLLTGVKPPDALARASALAKSMPDPLRPANEIHPAVGCEISEILFRAMAISPEDRHKSASDFREALRLVGRKENRQAEDRASRLIAEAADTSVTAMVRKDRGADVDPFDSYSILKPDDAPWRTPRQGLRPGMIAAMLVVLLAVGCATFYGFSSTVPSEPALNYVKSFPAKDSSATTVHQNKSDNSRAKSSSTRNVLSGSGGEVSRKPSPPKRRTLRPDTARSKPPALTPPRVSIYP